MIKTEDFLAAYTRKKVVSITCDHCGKEMFEAHPPDHKSFLDGWTHGGSVTASGFGYGSDHDDSRWDFDICDACVPKLLKWFKKAEVSDGQ